MLIIYISTDPLFMKLTVLCCRAGKVAEGISMVRISLIEAFALLTSTSTTSSSLLLSAMVSGQLLVLQHVALLRDDQHGAKLIPANLVKADMHRQFQRAHQ